MKRLQTSKHIHQFHQSIRNRGRRTSHTSRLPYYIPTVGVRVLHKKHQHEPIMKFASHQRARTSSVPQEDLGWQIPDSRKHLNRHSLHRCVSFSPKPQSHFPHRLLPHLQKPT